MNVLVIVLYLITMVVIGLWAARRARTATDYRVAGRRLGTGLYTSTMAAVVLGGASTVGGVGLGYQYGISGMWLVVAIAVGHPPGWRRGDRVLGTRWHVVHHPH